MPTPWRKDLAECISLALRLHSYADFYSDRYVVAVENGRFAELVTTADMLHKKLLKIAHTEAALAADNLDKA